MTPAEKIMREALEFYENTTCLMLDVRDIPIDPISEKPKWESLSIKDDGQRAREDLKRADEAKEKSLNGWATIYEPGISPEGTKTMQMIGPLCPTKKDAEFFKNERNKVYKITAVKDDT